MKRFHIAKSILLLTIIFAKISLQPNISVAQEIQTSLNDSLFLKQKQLFEKLNVFGAWKLTKGSPDILIGVIDNGFDFFHPDLKDQLIPGFYASGGYHTEIVVNVVCIPHEKRYYSADDSPMGTTEVEFKGMYDIMPSGATSSAAPIVTSLAALVYSLRPELDAKSVIEIIKQGCDDIGEKGYDIYTGYGRVNFAKTLKLAKNWEKMK